uniref:Lipase domain-containing protein n=1 Tax=Anopheles quadriannulatus TaxID=34691 RepID=A0A182XKM8_ANOQN
MYKYSAVLLLLGLVAAASAASLSAPAPDSWMLIPDGNGRLHLANLNPYNMDETVPEPHFTAATDTIFRLYTRSNRDTPQVVTLNNAGSLSGSNFNAAHPTRFIIHGWNNDGFSEVNMILKDAWLDRGDFNVFTVDWGVGAQTINYPFARARVGAVGNVVSTFINFLQANTGITFASVSIAGHSLGAHAAGNAGFFQFGRLNTIFGMDPALPLFSLDSNDRLTLNDAQYVESIHTNAGLLGFDLPLGQASFYPNGGRTQPGCGVDITGACAHGRAYEFLAESIVSGGFTSVRCGSYDEILTGNCSVQGASRPMGGEPSNFGTGTEGVFTLSTLVANMKAATVILSVLGLVALGSAAPVESNHPWALIPDGNGRLRLINVNPYDVPKGDNEVEPLFDPLTDVVFRLYTRRNPVHPQVIRWNDAGSVSGSNFNPAHPTRFLIHGFLEGEDASLHWAIKDHFIRVGEFNIVNVDWGAGSQTINYIAARNRVGAVGEVISRMINTIVSATGASRNNINLIGHSLGAHVAANAGKHQNGQLNTIIGLDPAGPLFSNGQADLFGANDAQYTEAIFTNAGLLGFDQPLAHANFYPNGGRSQPGCILDVAGICAHNRVNNFYAESVSSSVGFRSTRCANHAEILQGRCTPSGANANMGGEPSNRGRGVNGVYFLTTNSNSPFAQG